MKIIKTIIIINLSFIVAFSQSYGRRFQEESARQPTRVLDVGQVQQQQQFQQQQLQYYSLEERIDPETYIVGPGDIFSINILSSENFNFTLKINPSGEIMIPTVGVINLGRVNLRKAINKIEDAISKNYKNADIHVSLNNIREFKIQIAGAVGNPGFYTVTPVTRLNEILDEAGGFHQLAKEYMIQIKTAEGDTTVINYFNYLLEGSLKDNPQFLENEKIFVPFGNVEKNGVVIRGAIAGSGYDIIQENENLRHFLLRTAKFSKNADLNSVTITRQTNEGREIITASPREFGKIQLQPGDVIDILSERGISVNGFVQRPGSFNYFPGYSPLDYVNMAGGNTVEGDPDNIRVRHQDGTIEKGENINLKRGDVIIVPRTKKSVFFGEMSVLEIVSSVASVALTYIAATK